MSNLRMLAPCLIVGALLRRSDRVADGAHTVLNAVIIHLVLPAVTLCYLHAFRIDADTLAPVLMPWVLFAIGALLFWVLGRALKLPRASVGALTLVGGFGSASFVGLPMIESLQGRDGMALGLVIDQLGSYLAPSTAGVVMATLYAAEGPVSVREMARKVAAFPPFIALMAALALSPVAFPPALGSMLARVGAIGAAVGGHAVAAGRAAREHPAAGPRPGLQVAGLPGAGGRPAMAGGCRTGHDQPGERGRSSHAAHDRCRPRGGAGAAGADDDRPGRAAGRGHGLRVALGWRAGRG